MPTYDSTTAQCRVHTRKAGLLSAMAHDLLIEVTDFNLQIDGSTVCGRFRTTSLVVVHALEDGVPIESLSAKDKLEIQESMAKDVLETAKFPEATFVASRMDRDSTAIALVGELCLHGETKTVKVHVKSEGNVYVAEVLIHQPDFGIKPYNAMLGTLRVEADLVVRVVVPIA